MMVEVAPSFTPDSPLSTLHTSSLVLALPTSAMPPWIQTIPQSDATGELAALYAPLVDPDHGAVDNVLQIHSLHPDGLRAHLAVYRAAMKSTAGLRKVDRELIAVAVSEANGCHY